MAHYQQPSPESRRKAIIILLVGMLVCTALLLWLARNQPALQSWLETNIDYLLTNPHIVAGVSLLAVLPLFAVNIYLWQFSRRIIQAQRFPPPGVGVTRRTRVLSGRSAIRRARVIQFIVLFMSLNALALPWVLWSIFAAVAG